MNQREPGFSPIVDRQLSSVEFVRDYVQLRFDGGTTITLLTWPIIKTGTGEERFGSRDYRNELCSLIGQVAQNGSVEQSRTASILFSNGRALVVPLDENAYEGRPEAIIFKTPNEGWWVV